MDVVMLSKLGKMYSWDDPLEMTKFRRWSDSGCGSSNTQHHFSSFLSISTSRILRWFL